MEMCAISSIFRYLDLDFFPELIDNVWKQLADGLGYGGGG
jgi:hypothetical protein